MGGSASAGRVGWQVGLLWTANGAAALLSGLAAGRMRTEGREATIMAATMAALGAATAVLAVSPGLALAMAAMVAGGAVTGMFDVAFFSLRQRSVDPALLGRVLTVSASANMLGEPVGAALAGPVVAVSAPLWAPRRPSSWCARGSSASR